MRSPRPAERPARAGCPLPDTSAHAGPRRRLLRRLQEGADGDPDVVAEAAADLAWGGLRSIRRTP